MAYIVDLGDNNCQCVVQPQVLLSISPPSFAFLPFLPSVCFHTNLLPNWDLLALVWGQTGHCGPHLHNSSDGTFGNGMLLFGAELPRTIGQGIVSCFDGAFSALSLFSLRMGGAGSLFLIGGIGHDLATNKFVEAGTVLGNGLAFLVCGMADMAVAEALGSRDAGCSSIMGLLQMGISGLFSLGLLHCETGDFLKFCARHLIYC